MAKVAKGKGRHSPFAVACVGWMDLLGYGNQLKNVEFNPTDPIASAVTERLHRFHRTVAAAANRHLRVVAINDGAVATRDLSVRGSSVTYDFLHRLVQLHHTVNADDQGAGYPGCRMVIAVGFRMRTQSDVLTSTGKAEAILRKLQAGRISPEQAVWEAYRARPPFGVAAELHANFAFTKAYLADNAGKGGGFAGPNCFLDLTLFSDPLPLWLSIRRVVHWNGTLMSGTFGELELWNHAQAGSLHMAGVLDALEVAPRLLPGGLSNPWRQLNGVR